MLVRSPDLVAPEPPPAVARELSRTKRRSTPDVEDPDLVTGVVTGSVQVEQRTANGFGARVLLRVATATAVVGLSIAVVAEPSVLALGFLIALVPLCLMLAISYLSRGAGREVCCEVRRFRLAVAGGGEVECVAVGTLTAAEPRAGDHLEVRGRRDRHGIVAVRRILVTVTGVLTTPRPRMVFLLARAANVLTVVLFAAVVLLGGFLAAGLR